MRSAPETADEEARLAALYKYGVLDTDAEDVFDDFTRVASQICNTPIALISLVDSKRQWFKSKVGLDVSQTSRDIAFCSHAIHQHDIFEVPDTLKDARFYDNPLVTSDPKIRFYAGTPLVTSDGHAIGTLCTISDTPQQLTAHQREALDILGKAVIAQLELKLKVRQLNKVSQRKTDFLSAISHELRTPLNAIITLNQLMLEDVKHQTVSDKFTQYMKHIDYSGKRLLDLVNSVLDLSKVEAGKTELSPEVLVTREFFSSIEGVMRPKASQKDIIFNVNLASDVPDKVFFDESKLSQIIFNLLSNAIKFTFSACSVTLWVACTANELTLTVEDTGTGIAEEDLSQLFDKFTQVGKHNRDEGSGLGLAITKGLIELMDGTINIKSELGKGTTVVVNLPLTTPIDSSKNVESTTSQYNTNAKILVVEDNLINQEVAKAVFESLELRIDLAETGEEGVRMASHVDYDLIFMDLNLPGIDGWEATRQIRCHNTHTPIVALSANVFDAESSQFATKGIQNFVTKPIDRNGLLKVLGQTIPTKQTKEG